MSENIIIEMTQLIWKIIPDNQLCPSAEVIHDFSVLSLNYVAQGMLFVEREREREREKMGLLVQSCVPYLLKSNQLSTAFISTGEQNSKFKFKVQKLFVGSKTFCTLSQNIKRKQGQSE